VRRTNDHLSQARMKCITRTANPRKRLLRIHTTSTSRLWKKGDAESRNIVNNNTSAPRNTQPRQHLHVEQLSHNTTTTHSSSTSPTHTDNLHSLASRPPCQAPHRTSNNCKNTNVLHTPLQMPDMHAHPAHPVRAVQSRAAAQFRSRDVSEPDEETQVQ
jgi:hypothetical protein